jgi:integral membrane sensor domain MASE1
LPLKVASNWSQHLVRQVLAAAGYFLAARLSMAFALGDAAISLFWPAAGLALAMVIRSGRSVVVGLFVGAVASSLTLGHGLVYSLATAQGGMWGALAGAWSYHGAETRLRGFGQFRLPLQLFLASTVAAATAATTGVTGLVLVGFQPVDTIGHSFFTWLGGGLTGGLLVAALVVPGVFGVDDYPPKVTLRRLLAPLTFSAVLWWVFQTETGVAYIYLIVPALIFARLCCGLRAMYLAGLITATAFSLNLGPGNIHFFGLSPAQQAVPA